MLVLKRNVVCSLWNKFSVPEVLPKCGVGGVATPLYFVFCSSLTPPSLDFCTFSSTNHIRFFSFVPVRLPLRRWVPPGCSSLLSYKRGYHDPQCQQSMGYRSWTGMGSIYGVAASTAVEKEGGFGCISEEIAPFGRIPAAEANMVFLSRYCSLSRATRSDQSPKCPTSIVF